jgi:hypothetical protein
VSVPLRRGAWYRVVELDGRQVTLEVNQRRLTVSRPLLQVLPLRPPAWSVVPRPPNDPRPGDRYGVCPNCCDRAPLDAGARVLRCRRCRAKSAIMWSDAPWRALEVSTDTPDERVLARARAVALQALATAFRLRDELE